MTGRGAVVWVTGLPGVGKTTVALGVCERLRAAGELPVLLDGDALRAALPVRVGFHRSDRQRLAHFYADLARLLADQGHVVVCSTVSLFHEVHARNRKNVQNYLEVWLRAPVDALRSRHVRDALYGVDAEPENVVGVGTPAEFPVNPDLVIDNYDGSTPAEAVDSVITALADLRSRPTSVPSAR